MRQKKIALINDLTGYGRCSISVELPLISALKVQACPLPTAILSVHTGFPVHYMTDYTAHMQMNWHWTWPRNCRRKESLSVMRRHLIRFSLSLRKPKPLNWPNRSCGEKGKEEWHQTSHGRFGRWLSGGIDWDDHRQS